MSADVSRDIEELFSAPLKEFTSVRNGRWPRNVAGMARKRSSLDGSASRRVHLGSESTRAAGPQTGKSLR